MGFVAVQFEKLRLVKGLRVGEVFPGTIAIAATVRWMPFSGPKFQAPEYFCGSCHREAPSSR